jgi:uncharacterized membrane protein
MIDLVPVFPFILATHVALAIGLFVPSVLLPFTLRNRLVDPGYDAPPPGRGMRLMLAMQARGTAVIGAGLGLTGLAMVIVLGPRILAQPWLLVSLATYAVAAVVAFALQRPTLRRLAKRDAITTDADREAWRAQARRQRYIAYGIAGAVGVIGFLMSTKPALW